MQYTSPLSTTLPLFPSVLKTLSHPTSATRPLVYAYLLHHAEADPDTALLSINTIQKSLSDSNPRVRALALKTMSGIRVPVISQIVSLAIKKGVADMSPIVRKAAAFACVKCVRLDPSTVPQVTEYLATLLGDKQYFVAGGAVAAFMEVCPERLDLLHPHYRGLMRKLVDMDEWGQLATLRMGMFYARKCFPRRTRRVRKAVVGTKTEEDKQASFYADEGQKKAENEDTEDTAEYEEKEIFDPDLELLLDSALPLLQSRNSAVIVAVARTYLYLAPASYLHHAVGPLVALLRGPQDIQQVALHNLVQVCLAHPQLLVPYFRHCLIHSTEPPQTWRMKLELLTLIFPYSDAAIQGLILTELEHFSRGRENSLVRESVRAIGRCAQASDAKISGRCLRLLLKQVHSPDQHLVAEALEVVRHLIQRDPQAHTKTVIRLAKNLDTLRGPAARASVIWMVGEFAGLPAEQNIAPDVLRILVRGYVEESDEVRQQIVLLAAKVYLHWLNGENERKKENGPQEKSKEAEHGGYTSLGPEEDEGGFREHQSLDQRTDGSATQGDVAEKPHPISLLYHHTLLLARYTPSYDIRDRARLFRALLAVPSSTELASLLLLAPKPVPQAPSPSESRKGYLLGSGSLVIGEDSGVSGLPGYEALPSWVTEGQEPDSKLRDEIDTGRNDHTASSVARNVPASNMLDEALKGQAAGKPNSAPTSYKEKTLDSWLEEDEGSTEEEEEETEEEETEEESEEEDDDVEEESDEDESSEAQRLVT